MELNAKVRAVLIAQAHNDVVVGPGGDLEIGRKAVTIHYQRVVPGRFESIGQAFKKPGTVVAYS